MMKNVLCFLGTLVIMTSCLYKAGNRIPDVSKVYRVSVSPFYIKMYLKGLDTLYTNRDLITSEIVNFPENFVPVTDTAHGYKFVIEIDSFDSLTSLEENYIALASLYDFKKGMWVRDQDSLQHGELDRFKVFFRDSVLANTVKAYVGSVPDSILYVDSSRQLKIEALRSSN
ncbi:hypothetical protein [Paraflavitalea sp. CAU 1676]|uniref:hypothetical protein n=1 Tax=Paraflavitalea sp. CAU 1676 TaxID=3032598 RepID=UPI0023DBF140|nr:hypothetical protein [Paraflavitalea sp. CAU 1676]MDF2191688.1 hypothetical protein [Paraflavitalea sp. CAU 1676]